MDLKTVNYDGFDLMEMAYDNIMKVVNIMEQCRRIDLFTQFATDMVVPQLEMEGMIAMGLPPFPTLESLDILHKFFPKDNDIILSVNCRRCLWEACLRLNPWRRNIFCTTAYNNYSGKTFSFVKKTAYDRLPPTKCVLIILPHSGLPLLRWLKNLPKQQRRRCQYLAVIAEKDWNNGECNEFMECLVSLDHFQCTKIFELSNSPEDMRYYYQLFLFSTPDCSDECSVVVPKSLVIVDKSDTKDIRRFIRNVILRRLVYEIISVRPLELFSKVELLEDLPLFLPDVKIDDFTLKLLKRKLTMIFPSKTAISTIVKFLSEEKKVLSIGCGLAFWEYLISYYCVESEFVCTDIIKPVEPFLNVEVMSAMKAHEEYPDYEVVCICFPTAGVSYANEFVRAHKPRKIVLTSNRCVVDIATPELFQYLEECYTDNYCKKECEDEIHRFGSECRDLRDNIVIGLYTRK